ncbi:MAG TPA: hypothetical protein VHY08_00535, partial [Bacillota bacterium]|nr:hypothetical protein [Bacillota bacterium]
ARNEAVEILDVILAMYLYLFTEITGESQVTIHTFVDHKQVVAIKANRDELDGFSALFQLAHQLRNKPSVEDKYQLTELGRFFIAKDQTSILPLCYERSQIDSSLKLTHVFDLILEMSEKDGRIEFTQEYNTQRLNKEKIKELISGFIELTEQFASQYRFFTNELPNEN